jgi:hypothetical protein
VDKESLPLTGDSLGEITCFRQEAKGENGRLLSVANQPEPCWLDP